MNTFYLHDGQNEAGPFTLDELKKQRLTRNTPVRQRDTNHWLPAEKISGLKEIVVPKKILRPLEVLPAVVAGVSDLHRRRPVVLYGVLLLAGALAGIWLYKPQKQKHTDTIGAASPLKAEPAVTRTTIAAVTVPEGSIAKPDTVAKIQPAKNDLALATRRRWNKLISATNSNYGIGLLGGIKDLSVIVNNRSDYPLDEVVAKVTYIKASGGVWKTKLVTLYGVGANDGAEQAVPDAGRGKKVKVSLYKVVSKKMKFSYTEGQTGKNAADPYFKE